jgi:hypothetical protein
MNERHQLIAACGLIALVAIACGKEAGSSSGATGTSAGGAATIGAGGSSSTDGGGGAGASTGGGGEIPTGDGLPVGIPEPSFGYELDTDGAPTVWVDNQNPACDDAVGSADQPYCDLFRGQSSVTYAAGTIVHVLGGPYPIEGDLAMTLEGTEEAPVIIKGIGPDRILFDGEGERVSFEWSGSYGVLENLAFFHKTRHRIVGDYLVFHDVSVTNPEDAFIDFNPVVNVTGHDVLFYRGEIGNNRRDNDTDSHGIQAGQGSHHVFILENDIYNNNGDAFQACHNCFDEPPHHIYLGRNVMHEDRENGIDLKTIHDVVVSENVLYGYGSSSTSNGDAMVVGSNGFDDSINQGPRRIWVIHNVFHDSGRGIRLEGTEDVWVIGNVMENVGTGLQIDNKSHRSVVIASNTIAGVTDGLVAWGCQPDSLEVIDNLVVDVADRHVDFADCGESEVSLLHNLFSGGLSVRVDGSNYTDAGSLEAAAFASNNLDDDPAFEQDSYAPAPGSPTVDAGASLEQIYDAFGSSFGGDIAFDRAGTPRPSGAAEDIGAYELAR